MRLPWQFTKMRVLVPQSNGVSTVVLQLFRSASGTLSLAMLHSAMANRLPSKVLDGAFVD